MKQYTLKNLDCAQCAVRIETDLKKLEEVKDVSIDFASLTMHIETDDIEKVKREVKRIEPKLIMTEKDKTEKEGSLTIRRELIIIGTAVGAFVAGTVFEPTLKNTPFSIGEYAVFLSIYILAGWNVLLQAFRNIIRGRVFDENFLMSVSTIGAIAIHALSEAAMVMVFFRIGEFLQELSLYRSRRSIRALLEIKPEYANLLKGRELIKVKPEHVALGDTIVVKPGERIPLDGTVVEGTSMLDTSALTGESIPRSAGVNDPVLAGMVNSTGVLSVKVTKLLSESSIAKILSMVENAIHKKAKTEQFISSFARWYTPFVVLAALLLAVLPPLLVPSQSFSGWLYRALVLLVISCPCALVISIPLGYFGGIGGASKKGVLVKGSNYLDALSAVRTVVFDKTGTLTKGTFSVTDIRPSNGFSETQVLEWAAVGEYHSNHPIALSIKEAHGRPARIPDIGGYEEKAGYGVKAKVNGNTILVGNDRYLHDQNIEHGSCVKEETAVHVAVDGLYAGYISISDSVKEESAAAVEKLKRLGMKTAMLTGDSDSIAKGVKESLGIDEYYAELLPDGKVAVLERIMQGKKSRGKVAFVGDGINDAPVLARADVGIAMGEFGSDAAVEVSDVVLMSDSPLKVVDAVTTARKTRKIVWQNIIFALGVKGVFVVLGVFGVATMWEAVFADVGVAVLAVLNASRALR